MLYTTTIERDTLKLIKSLQAKHYLKGFYLAGDTALALYMGHRKSIDIDLFSNFGFDASSMIESIHQDYSFQIFQTSANTIKGNIEGINVDIIAHRYKLLNKPAQEEKIRVLSEPDILAMKLNAISISGQRSKDFIDIYFELKENRYEIRDIINFYRLKYQQENDMHILKSLIYFDDIDLSDWPVLLRNKKLKWNQIKLFLEKETLKISNSDQ